MMPPGPGSQPTSFGILGERKFRREIRRPAAVAVAGESRKTPAGDSERHEKPFCGTGPKLFLEMFLQFKRDPYDERGRSPIHQNRCIFNPSSQPSASS